MINRLRKGEAGFTLIELLVVVLILGILVAIAVPNFTNSADSAKDATAQANLRTAASELAVAKANNATTPTFQGGVTLTGTCLHTNTPVNQSVTVDADSGAIAGSFVANTNCSGS